MILADMSILRPLAALALVLFFTPRPLAAQTIGTYRWQLQPYCNVLTLTVVQEGGVYRLEGADDLCGAARPGLATGLALPNRDGTIGFGLTIVDAPSGLPVHVSAAIDVVSLGGTWRDALGFGGTIAFTPGAPVPSSPRPLTSVTSFQWDQPPGGPSRGIVARARENSHPTQGGAAVYGQWGDSALNMISSSAGVRGESADETGVLGISNVGRGVYGFTEGGEGVLGVSLGGTGIRAVTIAGTALIAQAGPFTNATALQIDGKIRVVGTAPAFRHVATPATIAGATTVVEHPFLDDDPNALVYVTPLAGAVRVVVPIGVVFVAPYWQIVTLDGTAMPAGAEFNVMVIKR